MLVSRAAKVCQELFDKKEKLRKQYLAMPTGPEKDIFHKYVLVPAERAFEFARSSFWASNELLLSNFRPIYDV